MAASRSSAMSPSRGRRWASARTWPRVCSSWAMRCSRSCQRRHSIRPLITSISAVCSGLWSFSYASSTSESSTSRLKRNSLSGGSANRDGHLPPRSVGDDAEAGRLWRGRRLGREVEQLGAERLDLRDDPLAKRLERLSERWEGDGELEQLPVRANERVGARVDGHGDARLLAQLRDVRERLYLRTPERALRTGKTVGIGDHAGVTPKRGGQGFFGHVLTPSNNTGGPLVRAARVVYDRAVAVGSIRSSLAAAAGEVTEVATVEAEREEVLPAAKATAEAAAAGEAERELVTAAEVPASVHDSERLRLGWLAISHRWLATLELPADPDGVAAGNGNGRLRRERTGAGREPLGTLRITDNRVGGGAPRGAARRLHNEVHATVADGHRRGGDRRGVRLRRVALSADAGGTQEAREQDNT